MFGDEVPAHIGRGATKQLACCLALIVCWGSYGGPRSHWQRNYLGEASLLMSLPPTFSPLRRLCCRSAHSWCADRVSILVRCWKGHRAALPACSSPALLPFLTPPSHRWPRCLRAHSRRRDCVPLPVRAWKGHQASQTDARNPRGVQGVPGSGAWRDLRSGYGQVRARFGCKHGAMPWMSTGAERVALTVVTQTHLSHKPLCHTCV